MSEEVYYYVVYFVDGKTQTITRNDDGLTALFKDVNKDRIIVDNTIINMHNVVRVRIETQTERDEKKQHEKEKQNEYVKSFLKN